MGLLLLQLLNQAGARSVSVVDGKAARLQAAKALGAASVAEDVAALDRRAFGVAVTRPVRPQRSRRVSVPSTAAAVFWSSASPAATPTCPYRHSASTTTRSPCSADGRTEQLRRGL